MNAIRRQPQIATTMAHARFAVIEARSIRAKARMIRANIEARRQGDAAAMGASYERNAAGLRKRGS